ncbi:MAG TPA: hypothetical protein VMF86_08010 [Stellaceae bacterium]|nr:hypothetical protein [Stellaceae bacterium]
MRITKRGAAAERRCERRYGLPALEVAIGSERFRAVNWSMRGALIYGLCDAVGARVRGEIGVPGSCEAMPFAATVVRADFETGNTAICFEDCRTEGIDFIAAAVVSLQ